MKENKKKKPKQYIQSHRNNNSNNHQHHHLINMYNQENSKYKAKTPTQILFKEIAITIT